MTKKSQKDVKCARCPACDGAGYQSIIDLDETITHVPCDHCLGSQCFSVENGIMADYYEGKCDSSCGHCREALALREEDL